MKIRVLPRHFFEAIKGTENEGEILAHAKIISINSSWGFDSVPPFSTEALASPNLLCLTFDDIEKPESDCVPFCREQAEEIMRFVDDGALPLLVHCTVGISRSGAVGEVLNWYFNRYLKRNSTDYDDFVKNNRQIMPNTLVRKIMLKGLEP